MRLLTDRQSLATAVLLREVLDKPMCQRRRAAPGGGAGAEAR
jgi:hypothetical protein